MNELRKDPLLNKWVVVLNDSKPPEYYYIKPSNQEKDKELCLLCPENKSAPFKEIYAIRDSEGNYKIRVIAMFDPILRIEGELNRKGVGMYDKMNGIGANEIIIESPSHNIPSEDMGIDQMINVITTYKYRLSELEKDPRLRYTLIYKKSNIPSDNISNHPCSLLIATPIIPKGIKDELDGAKAYYHYKERCIFCDIINEELKTGVRIIAENKGFIVFVPFAPRSPFEYWIAPKRHSCALQEIYDEEIHDLSMILMISIKKMKSILKNPPYSYVIHTAPNRMPRKNHWHTLGDDFHWHIEVVPQLLTTSLFEQSSGFYILTTSPEDSAKYLREAEPL